MKVKKTISITATEKETQTIGNFMSLFEEMYEDVWYELNNATDCRLEEALAVINDLYDKIEKDDD